MTATAPDDAEPLPVDVEEDPLVLKTKAKNEAYVTSNLGYGNAKKKELEAFNNVVWPGLTGLGWSQVDGTGDKNVGSVYFLPSKEVNIEHGRRGKDYYTRIKDVIDRVLQRRNVAESEIADAYQEAISENAVEYDAPPSPERTSKRLRPIRNATRLDLSWKEGGATFPRTTSRVGDEYQAVDLPSPDTFETEQERIVSTDSETAEQEQKPLHDQLWDPKSAEEAGTIDYVSDFVKYNLKEAAMAAFHKLGYDKDKLSESVSRFQPQDGSDWTDEEKAQFRIEIFRQRKDLSAVAKAMNKSVNSCMTYYLNSFKQSNDYRLLKTLRAEERAEQIVSSHQGVDACGICGDGGNLLICDGCEGEFHMKCMRPPLIEIPEGHWECDDCVNRTFLSARDNLIRNTRIYERVPVNEPNRKRKADEMNSDWSGSDGKNSTSNGEGKSLATNGRAGEIVLRPTPQVLEAVKKFANAISAALDPPKEKNSEGIGPPKEEVSEILDVPKDEISETFDVPKEEKIATDAGS